MTSGSACSAAKASRSRSCQRRSLMRGVSIIMRAAPTQVRTSRQAVGAREAPGRQAAGLAALAEPVGERRLGPHAGAGTPGESFLAREHRDVGKAAVLVALQDDAAAARHLR